MKKISAPQKLIGIFLLPAMFSGAVLAQETAVSDTAKKAEAYGVDDRGVIVRNTTELCWRTGYWTPAMAIPECDPDLAKKEEPKVAIAPAPAPAPAPAAPQEKTFSADALFDFNSANLKPAGVQALNDFAIGIQGINYDMITVEGHADRIGSSDYNMRLSLQRAFSVKAHLVSKGIAANRIIAEGKGESDPVTGNSCAGNVKSKALIACLAPDRRVRIIVKSAQ
ncbi:MAG: OmpA family protein [Nitrosomonas sp.]|nr:MAG: OmpA family protein [Nitrosomonas sp.]